MRKRRWMDGIAERERERLEETDEGREAGMGG